MPTVTVKAEKMVYGGDCIAKLEGKTIFIPYAIPGEVLEVEIVKEMRDYCTARIVQIKEKSEHRVNPFCPLYGRCGGCNMQHIDDEYQRELRSQILKDAFSREGIQVPEIHQIYGLTKGYRARFQFHNGGLMEKSSNEIVFPANCPCATSEVNRYLEETKAEDRPKGRVHVFGCKEISSIPEGYDKLVIAEEAEKEYREKSNENSKSQRRTPGGRLMKKQKKIAARFSGTNLHNANICTVSLNGKKITFDVKGFFQSNLDVLSKTIPAVLEGLEGKNVLDMYAGCGTFSTFLADKFENVILVEHNRDALVYAEQNMAEKKHESYGVSGENWVKMHAQNCIAEKGNFDAVVIDPPRSGMEKSVCQWLCHSSIPQIRSISCDIATHARDAKFLIKNGYNLEKLYLLDFYPQTCHIESLGVFTKNQI